jgi:oligopeptide transport system permease protein
MGGAIITERIFNINGVGNFLYRSIHQKDGVAGRSVRSPSWC